MSRDEIYNEIKGKFGLVPRFFKGIPDNTLELEWNLFKRMEIGKSAIPEKYRELIGLATSAATKCRYCTFFHTEMAKLMGATEEEIEEVLHFTKHTTGWSTYLNGLQLDYEEFKKEIEEAINYVKSNQEVNV